MLFWTLTSPVATFGGYWEMDGDSNYYWVPEYEGDEPTEPPPGSGGTELDIIEWHGGTWIIDGSPVTFSGTYTYEGFIPDADGDGLPDDWDPYPYDATNNSQWFGGGTWAINGVLQTWDAFWYSGSESLPDEDGDGLPDDLDPYPSDPENYSFTFNGGIFTRHGFTLALRAGLYAGSGEDADADGFPDDLDGRFMNPAAYGTLQQWAGGTFLINGEYSTYPPLYYYAPAVSDVDGDGIPDELDAAPEDPWNGTYFYWAGGTFPVDGVPTFFPPRSHGGLFADTDGDTIPDAADPYPADPANNSAWWSGGTFTIDGIPTEFPGQWHRANAGDGDNDGIPEDIDPYPGDPNNPTIHQFTWQGGTFLINGQSHTFPSGAYPGVWADTDEDLIPDSLDPYPADPANNSAWWQGGTFTVDGQPHTFPAQWHRADAGDADEDGIPDDLDPYPGDPLNPTPVTHSWQGGVFRVNGVEQTLSGGTYPGLWSDVDGDTIPDAADPYPADNANNSLWWPGGTWLVEGEDQTFAAQWIAANAPDTDGDGIPDALDPFPADSWNGTGWWWPEAPSLTVKINNQNVTFPRQHYLSAWSDTDGDGIPDIADPLPHDFYNGNDTDGDGIPDSIEAQYPGVLDLNNPADAHTLRADGVSYLRAHLYNQQAAAVGQPGLILPLTTLIPQERDTDLDTMPDRYEAAHGLNPFDNQDAAGGSHDDLVLIAEKAAAGLNPWDEVLPEDYETVTGQDPATMWYHDTEKSYAENDWDGDGVSNVDELLVFHTPLRDGATRPDDNQILDAMLQGRVSQTTWLNFEYLIQPDTQCVCGGPDCPLSGCTCSSWCDNWNPHYCGCGGYLCPSYECYCSEMCDGGSGGGGSGGGGGGSGGGGGGGTMHCECSRTDPNSTISCTCPEGSSTCDSSTLCGSESGGENCGGDCHSGDACACPSGTSCSRDYSLPPPCSYESPDCSCGNACLAMSADPLIEGDAGTPCNCSPPPCNSQQTFECPCPCNQDGNSICGSFASEDDIPGNCKTNTLLDPPPGHVRAGEFPCSPRLPVEVVVHKKDEAPPTDGMLAKVGDTLVYKITDDPTSFPLPASAVTWEWRKLKGNGTFGSWTTFSSASGPRVEALESGAGIFQIRVKITAGGLTHYFDYVRKKDDPHGKDSAGSMNPIYKAGQPDYVGIAAGQPQYLLASNARAYLGSTAFAESATVPISATATAMPGDPKCNIWVYYACMSTGATIPLDSGGWPPRANDWINPSFTITGWTHHATSWEPEPGVVVGAPHLLFGVGPATSLASGHVGILDYDGGWVSAGPGNVNRWAHLTTFRAGYASFRKN